MKRMNIKYFMRIKNQAGATLLVIIIGMIVVAVIGTALYTMTSTALLNQVIAQRAARAYYLAESGLRLVASACKAATNKNPTMVALHGQTLTLPDNVSQVTLELYPLWLYAHEAIAAGETSITLYVPGGAPISEGGAPAIPASGLLRLQNQFRPAGAGDWIGTLFTDYTFDNEDPANNGVFNAANGGTPFTFILDSAFTDDIVAGDEFYIGNKEYTTAQAASAPGSDLVLNVNSDDINMAKIFPSQKGSFIVVTGSSVSTYKYDYRIVSTAANTVKLTNIQPVSEGALFPLDIAAGEQVYMGRTLGLAADSQYGD
jgi:Tfp pilus assembly protein PilV